MDIKIQFFIFFLLVALSHTQRVELVCNVTEMSFGDLNNLPTCVVAGDFKIHTQNTNVYIRDLQKLSSIRGLVAKNKEIFYLPPGNKNFVWYTKAVIISNTQLRKVTSDNLISFIYLQYLDMSQNEIEILGPNLFQHNKNLRTLIFDSNRIQIIDSKIFQRLQNLEYLGLGDNACVSKVAHNRNEILDLTGLIEKKCWDDNLELLKDSMQDQCKTNY